jgi:hypothetical protein
MLGGAPLGAVQASERGDPNPLLQQPIPPDDDISPPDCDDIPGWIGTSLEEAFYMAAQQERYRANEAAWDRYWDQKEEWDRQHPNCRR